MLAEGGVHFMLCYVRRHRACLAVVSVLFFALSYIIKLNYLILGIAVSITLLLLFFTGKKEIPPAAGGHDSGLRTVRDEPCTFCLPKLHGNLFRNGST